MTWCSLGDDLARGAYAPVGNEESSRVKSTQIDACRLCR